MRCLIIKKYLRYGETCIKGFEICLFRNCMSISENPAVEKASCMRTGNNFNQDITKRKDVGMNMRTTRSAYISELTKKARTLARSDAKIITKYTTPMINSLLFNCCKKIRVPREGRTITYN